MSAFYSPRSADAFAHHRFAMLGGKGYEEYIAMERSGRFAREDRPATRWSPGGYVHVERYHQTRHCGWLSLRNNAAEAVWSGGDGIARTRLSSPLFSITAIPRRRVLSH